MLCYREKKNERLARARAVDAEARVRADAMRRQHDDNAAAASERRWRNVRLDENNAKSRANRESVKGADLVTHRYADTEHGRRLASADDAAQQQALVRSAHLAQRGHNTSLCGYDPVSGLSICA